MSTPERWVIVDGHEDLAMGALADGATISARHTRLAPPRPKQVFENPNTMAMLGLADWLAATPGNGFGLFEPFSGPAHSPLVATGCAR